VTRCANSGLWLKINVGVFAAILMLPLYALAQQTAPSASPGTSPSPPTSQTPNAPTSQTPNATTPSVSQGGTSANQSRPRRSARNPTERVAERIASLHEQLGITSAQETQWNDFAQVMRDNASHMQQRLTQRSQEFGQLNAVDNMKSFAAIAEQYAQDMQRLATAFQPLYDSFSDEQKKTADEVFQYRPRRHTAHGRKKH
jgi:periplasmic protein CpxP/Spy